MGILELTGFLGAIFLILAIYAIIKVAQSNAGAFAKAIWVVVLLCFPILGFFVWLIFGPSSPR